MKLLMFNKKIRSFHVYQMSSNEDYFYIHPNSVMLGFLGAVAVVLSFVIFALWFGYKIW
jgi:hypothetical protein